ncbi:RNA polymerase sigma factor [Paucibacter sp. PLA-PC-4]|uniref:RNA polymerase sigma factor n=1 Tax=Paucibacter sp. PLA-PC-4 TaxID=2993655 RepID=UPI00224B741F|nr:RNA polymerase sigma factor [Paucibacter sp. PLA-PC-4]MCX2863609.1 RNA polymerase sigma factor [Paucibacter sp. PLA-PC-4]
MKKQLPAVFSRIRSALRRRGTTQETDDYIQEAFARLASYEREQVVLEPEAFLMRTAINLSIDAHRARVVHGEQVVLEEVILVDDSPPVESVVLGRERLARLEQCLGRLGEKPREIFLAHRVDGLTYREIADQQGLSISTVEKHVAKATMQLITLMKDW